MNSWLVGLVKCAYCGYALHFNHGANRDGTKQYYRFIDFDKMTLTGCPTPPLKIRPQQVESAVFTAMQERVEQFNIAKHETGKPDSETESIKTELVHIDNEIQKLMEKLPDADSVLFDYIQMRISTLHEQKSGLEKKMHTMSRKRKAIDTKPLEQPMKQWDNLTIKEKHDIAVAMIDVMLVSDEKGYRIPTFFANTVPLFSYSILITL